MNFQERLLYYKNLIEAYLSEYFGDEPRAYGNLIDSMNYSLNAGGKRLRPALVLEFCRVCGGDVKKAIPVAAGVEMLHQFLEQACFSVRKNKFIADANNRFLNVCDELLDWAKWDTAERSQRNWDSYDGAILETCHEVLRHFSNEHPVYAINHMQFSIALAEHSFSSMLDCDEEMGCNYLLKALI